MAEMTSYEPGTPCWVDLGSRDTQRSATFYGSLFGWESQVMPDAGGYTMFTQDGQNVAAVGPLMGEGQPEVWTTYISVTDADATAKAVEAAGGRVLMDPFDVLDAGRMAVCVDDGGVAFSVWQPKAHIGAQLVNEPVSLCWNELISADVDKSKAFYAEVVGWEAETSQMGPMVYTEWKLAGRTIGGMREKAPPLPPEVPAHWVAYFAVADTDATVAKATELGGAVMMPAMDIPPAGRMAVLADPHGATFSVIAMGARPA